MSASGAPDGWTVWRKRWLVSELVDYGNVATQTAALLTAARREAEREGLETVGGIIHQRGEWIEVTFNVRPRDAAEAVALRE